MEFGKVENLEGINFKLPPEDPLTLPFLSRFLYLETKTQFYIGAPAWGHRNWIGKIYPPSTKTKDFLFHYAQSFNSIELNTSHYRVPDEEQTRKWIDQVSSGFLFLPKIVQGISHSENGLLDKKLLAEWTNFLARLGDFGGPSFLQLPPYFDYSKKAQLFQFLQTWPSEFSLALEFRHPSWFREGRILPALTEYLQKHSIGLVITDVAGRRDVLHTSVSAPFTMIRFVGNNLDSSDFQRSEEWALQLKKWSEEGLQKVFFVVHQPDDIFAPEMAKAVVEEWRAKNLADLPEIRFYESPELSFPMD